jgi:hypothetical protein
MEFFILFFYLVYFKLDIKIKIIIYKILISNILSPCWIEFTTA